MLLPSLASPASPPVVPTLFPPSPPSLPGYTNVVSAVARVAAGYTNVVSAVARVEAARVTAIRFLGPRIGRGHAGGHTSLHLEFARSDEATDLTGVAVRVSAARRAAGARGLDGAPAVRGGGGRLAACRGASGNERCGGE